ncbi:acetate/propionate family kinase [Mycoplasmopsis gallinarum]
MNNQKLLVVNSGSSSIKIQLFNKQDLSVIASGLAERITSPDGQIEIKFNGEKFTRVNVMPNHKVAVEELLDFMEEINLVNNPQEIEIIGFRVVHGGTYFKHSTILDSEAINLIDKCSIYAPLHNPGALQAINAFKEVMPHAKLSATFDTTFHTTIPDLNAIYPIPYEWTKEYGIRRYGAHGISHNYITLKLAEILNKDKVNLISMHIGSGASIAAVENSQSIDTSMGLTPLAGIMMGTRSGDIDPSIIEFVSRQTGMDVFEITNILNKKSGLLGVSQLSNDTRDIDKAIHEGNQQAQFAFDLYVQKIVDYVANYANKVPNLDALVFTAGVGENSPELRSAVVNKLKFANIKLDENKNKERVGQFALISAPESEIKVYVIRTNEELLIAQNALELFN